jgi:hypothetical protein
VRPDARVEATVGQLFDLDAEVAVEDLEVEGRVVEREETGLAESGADLVGELLGVEYPGFVGVAKLDQSELVARAVYIEP